MKPNLTDKSIRYIIRQLEGGRSTRIVVAGLYVIRRHIRRPSAEYRKSGMAHVQHPAGRPADPAPSDGKILTILDSYNRRPEGAVRTAKRLRKEGNDMCCLRAYRIMKSSGLVVNSPARSKRKWVRYQCPYSNATWHTDLHMMGIRA